MRDISMAVWKRAPWLILVIAGAAALAGIMIPRGNDTPAQPALAGTTLPPVPAPGFQLTDQFGHYVSLAQFRGHTVVLTFMGAHCTELCPVVAEKIRRVVAALGPAGKNVVLLVISTDPEHDTRAAVTQFSRAHGLFHRWHYLTGGRKTLAPIWHAYYLYVAPANAPPVLSNAHTSVIYLIDSKGRERVLMSGDPDSVALGRDIRILSGLPVTSGAQSIAAPEIGHPAPNFTLTLLNGKTIRLSALRHHVVLLNFWATWCTACKSEMPMLAQWSHMLRDRSFLILGVDMQESASEAGPFARKLHILYPIALDNSGAVAARYDVVGLPSSFLIDANGIITSVRPGILKKDYLASDVKPLVQG